MLIAPYRHPLTVAHEFATLDAISGGRVMMGVGAGWSQAEFEGLGVSFDDRNEITDECVQIYKLAWAEPVLEFHGRFFDFDDLSMDPKPARPLGPPVYVGGTFGIAARRAARFGDGFYPMFLDLLARPSRMVSVIDALRREADLIGRDLGDFDLLAMPRPWSPTATTSCRASYAPADRDAGAGARGHPGIRRPRLLASHAALRRSVTDGVRAVRAHASVRRRSAFRSTKDPAHAARPRVGAAGSAAGGGRGVIQR